MNRNPVATPPVSEAFVTRTAHLLTRWTTLAVLATLVAPTSGEVRYGQLTARQSDAALRRRIGLLAHELHLYPELSARQNLTFFAKLYGLDAGAAVDAALASAGGELRLANGVALLAKFDGEFASHSSTYAGTGTVRYTW